MKIRFSILKSVSIEDIAKVTVNFDAMADWDPTEFDDPPSEHAGDTSPTYELSDDTTPNEFEDSSTECNTQSTQSTFPKMSRDLETWKKSVMHTAELGVKMQLQALKEQQKKVHRSNSIGVVTYLILSRWKSARSLMILEPKTCYLDDREVGSTEDIPRSKSNIFKLNGEINCVVSFQCTKTSTI